MDCYEIRKKQLEEQVQELKKELATLEQQDLYEITADQARELVVEHSIELENFNKKHIMRLIEESAKEGYEQVKVPYQLSPKIQEWLIKLGYTVGLDSYTIYWK